MTTPAISKLMEQIRKGRSATPTQSTQSQPTKSNSGPAAAFIGSYDDTEYIPHLKGMFNGWNTYVTTDPIDLLVHLETYCAKRNVTKVVTTRTSLLSKLLERQGTINGDPKLSNYAGSLFTHAGIDIVFVDPLAQLLTVTYGKFLTARYISKLVAADSWIEATQFSWTLLDATNIDSFYANASTAFAIAIDIETTKHNLAIRCISYCCLYLDSNTGSISSESVVLPLDSTWALAWMRRLNDTPAAKIFQNGKYDNTYLLRYNAPVRNWLWDTAHLMHSYYSELPKDLAFLNAFFLRKVVYWKDLAKTNDLFEYYKYNALDSWATANVWISWMLSAPEWARHNYTLEFPLVFPCLLAEMTGLKRDQDRLIEARKEIEEVEAKKLASLRKMIGAPNFNPGSPDQVVRLLHILGCKDLKSSKATEVAKAKLRHPLNGRILDMISGNGDEDGKSIRGLRKIKNTYLRTDDDAKQSGIHAGEGGAKEYRGRILYALNPHGTDTGRLASKEHHYWCGLQIQNIPRGPEVKQTLCADDGFILAECDLEQAESRDTAHIAGDTALIAAVSGSRDFHSVNASAFFGRPYDSIYDDSIGKTKDKKLRDLAKRVNHGANYNMGPGVLIDTMGLDKIWEAKKLLGLPFNDPKEIAAHLLGVFHKTYPAIKGKYYVSVVNEIGTSRKLVSRAYNHTEYNVRTYTARDYIEQGDWTRYCFGKPDKNKLDLNSLVAHGPQSLNARTLNEAFMKVFYEIALPNPTTFRLHAQIHDSILFSYEKGREDLAQRVRECMEIPVTVRDVSGTMRTFTVPAALKNGTPEKPAKYWNETE